MNNRGLSKHDLSYNEVKLDYEALIAVATSAAFRCKQEVEDRIGTLQNEMFERKYSHAASTATYLMDAANALARALETLYVLKEGVDRDIVTIVNHKSEEVR